MKLFCADTAETDSQTIKAKISIFVLLRKKEIPKKERSPFSCQKYNDKFFVSMSVSN
jgi:hypothetical protein